VIHIRGMIDPTQPPNGHPDEAESEQAEFTGHPLFPRAFTETGPDRRKFDWIQVVRYLPDGTREVCPKMFKGSELRSWQQLLDEYGGECTYQIGAQRASDHCFTAWSEKAFFASPPRKAFNGGPWMPKQDPVNAAPSISQQTTNDTLLIMLVKLLAERRDPPPPPPPPNPAEWLHGVAALLNGLNRGPSGIEMVKEMMPLMSGGERTNRSFMQGIEIARDLFKNAPAESARSNSDDLSAMMDLAKLFTAVRPANPPAPAAPAQTPAPAPNQQHSAVPVPPCPPPPGYGWMFTQQGWVAFHLGMTNTQFANRPAPIPTAPQAPAAPMPQIQDEDVMLRKLLEHPEMRAKLQAMLAEPPRTPAPVPHPAPPAPPPVPIAAQTTPQSSAPVQAPPGATQVPAHALPDMLAASGWTITPAGATPAAWHFTKPSEPPAPPITPPPAVSPAQPPQNTSFIIPDNVPMNDDLRALIGDPEFQKIALAVVGPESQEAFAKLVQQNAQHLQEMPEA